MKNIIVGFVITLIVLLSINISMTVNARDIRQQEAENALDSALEGTISTLSKNTYSINNQEEYIADLVMALTEQIQSDSSVTIRVLDTDYDKGIMSIQVTETYKHINGKTGNVVAKKTVILEDKEHQDINNDVNMYTIQYLYPDNTIYKYMTVSEGTFLYEPANPYPDERIYWTSDNAVVSFPFTVNSDKIINFKRKGLWYDSKRIKTKNRNEQDRVFGLPKNTLSDGKKLGKWNFGMQTNDT